MIDADMPTFMARPLAISPADLRGADAVIIGAPYAAGWTTYAGLDKREWLAGPKRVRQQSVRYASGYVQEFDLDVFEHCRVVDFGDAHIPPEVNERPTSGRTRRVAPTPSPNPSRSARGATWGASASTPTGTPA